MGSLALVAVFLLSSGGSDLMQSTQRARPEASGAGVLREQERKDLESQAAQFEAELKAAPGNMEALEVGGTLGVGTQMLASRNESV